MILKKIYFLLLILIALVPHSGVRCSTDSSTGETLMVHAESYLHYDFHSASGPTRPDCFRPRYVIRTKATCPIGELQLTPTWAFVLVVPETHPGVSSVPVAPFVAETPIGTHSLRGPPMA